MEANELTYLETYAERLNDAWGDLGALSREEREHFRALLQKYELEQRLNKLAEELSQTPLPGLEG